MGKQTNIDERIRDAFKGRQSQTPDGIWNAINQSLDAETQLDNALKKATEDIHQSAPEHVWQGVKRQLTINRSWEVIHKTLDRLRFFRILWRAALPIFLFSFVGTGIYLGWREESQIPPGLSAASAGQQLPGPGDVNPANGTPSVKGHERSQFDHQEAPIAAPPNAASYVKQDPSVGISRDNKTKRTNPQQAGFGDEKRKRASVEDQKQISLAMPFLPPPVLGVPLPHEPPLIGDPFVLTDAAKENHHPYLLGIFYTLNNTWLINNEVRQSFDPNSLVSADATFAGGYGLNGTFYTAPQSGIGFQAYLRSISRISYFLYDDGKYINREIALSYYKLSLSYVHDFHMPLHSASPVICVQGGAYAALLDKVGERNSGGATTGSEYKVSDFGLSLQAGYRYRAGHMVLGTGVNIEKGLHNIFAGSSLKPASFNVTTPFNIGAYVKLQYFFEHNPTFGRIQSSYSHND